MMREHFRHTMPYAMNTKAEHDVQVSTPDSFKVSQTRINTNKEHQNGEWKGKKQTQGEARDTAIPRGTTLT